MATNLRDFSAFAAALSNQYAIERELGRGGMGIVYLARDLKLDRQVAIKTLPAHLATDEKMRERFLREARTAAALSHPNIVPIHRADEIDGHVFFVMGYVDGESVAQRVEREGALPPDDVTRMMREVAGALHAAHVRGIVHRDVKAENILLDRATGRALVTDFGIARLAEATPLTVTGLVLGTVHYMSPEHVSGESVDARSDVYSLGIVAFFALTGIFPFVSESPYAVLVAHVTRPAPSIREITPGISHALGEIVDRCLAKDPADRFESCLELIDALVASGDRERGAVVPARRAVAPIPPRSGGLPVSPQAIGTRRDSPVLLSDAEARAVWDRAALLQEQTKGFPVPDIAALDRDRAAPRSPTSAFRIDVVRQSAREAGIATEFVNRALVEHGHLSATDDDRALAAPPGAMPSVPATAAVVRDMKGDAPSPWSGGPQAIEYEVVLDGEMPESEFDWIVETIRRNLGDVGIASTVGRSLSWRSGDPKRQISVTVNLRGGRTTIAVAEKLTQLRTNIFGGWVGGLGSGLAMPAFAIAMRLTESGLIGAGAAVGAVGGIYAGSRMLYRRMVRDRRREARALAERLAIEAESSIRDLAAPTRASYLPRRGTLTREGT